MEQYSKDEAFTTRENTPWNRTAAPTMTSAFALHSSGRLTKTLQARNRLNRFITSQNILCTSEWLLKIIKYSFKISLQCRTSLPMLWMKLLKLSRSSIQVSLLRYFWSVRHSLMVTTVRSALSVDDCLWNLIDQTNWILFVEIKNTRYVTVLVWTFLQVGRIYGRDEWGVPNRNRVIPEYTQPIGRWMLTHTALPVCTSFVSEVSFYKFMFNYNHV